MKQLYKIPPDVKDWDQNHIFYLETVTDMFLVRRGLFQNFSVFLNSTLAANFRQAVRYNMDGTISCCDITYSTLVSYELFGPFTIDSTSFFLVASSRGAGEKDTEEVPSLFAYYVVVATRLILFLPPYII